MFRVVSRSPISMPGLPREELAAWSARRKEAGKGEGWGWLGGGIAYARGSKGSSRLNEANSPSRCSLSTRSLCSLPLSVSLVLSLPARLCSSRTLGMSRWARSRAVPTEIDFGKTKRPTLVGMRKTRYRLRTMPHGWASSDLPYREGAGPSTERGLAGGEASQPCLPFLSLDKPKKAYSDRPSLQLPTMSKRTLF